MMRNAGAAVVLLAAVAVAAPVTGQRSPRPFARVVIYRGWATPHAVSTIELGSAPDGTSGLWEGPENPVGRSGWTCQARQLGSVGRLAACWYGAAGAGPEISVTVPDCASASAVLHDITLRSPDLDRSNEALPDSRRGADWESAALQVGCE